MLNKYIGSGIKGFYIMASKIREKPMSHTTKQKLDALELWKKHSLQAACDAYNISRSSLYAWRQAYRTRGLSAIENRSTTPRRRRRRNWPPEVVAEIRRRRKNYHFGAQKIHVLIKPWCAEHNLPCPSARTIARIIADTPDKMRDVPCTTRRNRIPRRDRKPRLGKGFKAAHPGHCVALDTIERRQDGRRRYLFTAVDHHSRFSFAMAALRSNSETAAFFMGLVVEMFPGRIEQVLTDNGSEFQGAFDQWLEDHKIRHCWTYPSCPEMNAYNERFNRTIQEEYVDEGDVGVIWGFTPLQPPPDRLFELV